jgi:hypothetical protein
MAPPKNHAVGDILIVVYVVHMLHFDEKLIKIIKEHMYCHWLLWLQLHHSTHFISENLFLQITKFAQISQKIF